MTYTLNPLTDRGIGAAVRGLDLRQPVSDSLRRQLNEDFAQRLPA